MRPPFCGVSCLLLPIYHLGKLVFDFVKFPSKKPSNSQVKNRQIPKLQIKMLYNQIVVDIVRYMEFAYCVK